MTSISRNKAVNKRKVEAKSLKSGEHFNGIRMIVLVSLFYSSFNKLFLFPRGEEAQYSSCRRKTKRKKKKEHVIMRFCHKEMDSNPEPSEIWIWVLHLSFAQENAYNWEEIAILFRLPHWSGHQRKIYPNAINYTKASIQVGSI